MRTKKTERGFRVATFADLYGKECSIQESSLASPPALWLGCDTGSHHHVTGQCSARMHLDRKLARKLIVMLERFVEKGTLAP